jgi:hypothetical protein
MRYRKHVSIILLAAFVLMTADCVSTRSVTSARLKPEEKNYQIVRILKKTGERIDVDKANPARIVNNEILISGVLKVPAAGTRVAEREGGFIITSANGSTYETNDVGRDRVRDHLIFRTKSDIVIPLSEVSAVWTKGKNAGLTLLAVVGGAVVVVVVASALLVTSIYRSIIKLGR